MEWFRPTALGDLGTVFDRVQAGAAIALSPGAGPDDASNAAEVLPPTKVALPGAGSCLGVWSSGSGGHPRLVWWPWAELRSAVNASLDRHAWTWASPFQPSSFAGVQVALQAWATGGKSVSLHKSLTESARVLVQHQCEALSCTPTFIDLLIQHGCELLPRWRPRQITLSGEVLTSVVGGRVAERFADARVTAIYATSELGVLFRTRRLDGWYEVNGLDRRDWRVREQALEINRQGSWVSTGDLVDVQDDLIRVVGRADAVANVGGTKVRLAEIGSLAEQVPGVRRAVAVAVPSRITGQVVSLRYAVDTGCDVAQVTSALQERLRHELRKEAWPRSWIHDEVGPSVNAKRRSVAP